MNLRTYKTLLCGFLLSTILFVIGAATNVGVQHINYGYMPVEIEGCTQGIILDHTHMCAGDDTRLRLLDDCIYVKNSIISLGDIGIISGEVGSSLMLLITGILVLIDSRKQ